MNKEQLEAIKERANKATEGPWKIFEDSEVKAGCQIGTAWDHPQAKGPVGIVNLATSVTGGEIKNCVYIQDDDARFIAHARQDVPALIAEVERLQKVLKNTDADLYVYKDLYDEMTDKNIELIKFLQTRIAKGWGQKAVDLAMIHIQEQEKEVERLQQFERKAIYTMEENARLRIYEKQIQKLHAAATRVENEETDSFEFGEEVLGILGRLM